MKEKWQRVRHRKEKERKGNNESEKGENKRKKRKEWEERISLVWKLKGTTKGLLGLFHIGSNYKFFFLDFNLILYNLI